MASKAHGAAWRGWTHTSGSRYPANPTADVRRGETYDALELHRCPCGRAYVEDMRRPHGKCGGCR